MRNGVRRSGARLTGWFAGSRVWLPALAWALASASASPGTTVRHPHRPGLALRAPAPRANPRAAKAPVLTLDQYRERLLATSAALQRLQLRRVRPVEATLAPLAQDVVVQRRDGAQQEVSGIEWASSADGDQSSRAAVVDAQKRVTETRRALEAWARAAPLGQPGAAALVRQMQAANQIQIVPPWPERTLAHIWATLGKWITAIADWISKWFPATKAAPAPLHPARWPEALLWALLVGALILLLAYLVLSLRDRFHLRRPVQQEAATDPDAELLLLPPEVLKARAEEFAAAGDYREALRYRYLGMLLSLDALGLWSYNARRTNWEHLGGLRSAGHHGPLLAPLARITRQFDRVRYGGATCSAQEWDRFAAVAAALEQGARAGTGKS